MKSTKTLLFAALAVGSLLVGLPANAQDSTNAAPAARAGGNRGMRGGPNIDQLATELKLTDDQKAKVKPILEAQRQKMTDLRQDTTLSQEDRRTKMQAIREDTLKQMKEVLTPEQYDQYQKMGQRNRRNAPPANPPAAAPQQ
jgi:periplasmic protein CpxP/Spy